MDATAGTAEDKLMMSQLVEIFPYFKPARKAIEAMAPVIPKMVATTTTFRGALRPECLKYRRYAQTIAADHRHSEAITALGRHFLTSATLLRMPSIPKLANATKVYK
jgi:hypothetical protein